MTAATRAQSAHANSDSAPAIEKAEQATFGFKDEVKEPEPMEVGAPKSALDEQLGEMIGQTLARP